MKQLCTLSLFAIGILCSQSLLSQVPQIEWQRVYGSYMGDYAKHIEPTSDGGFIVAGYTEFGGGDVEGYHGNPLMHDGWVLKLDKAGAIQWQKCLGGENFEELQDIKQTPDGGYIIGGYSGSNSCDFSGNHGGADYWVIKLNSGGDVQWQRLLGGSNNDYCNSISLTKDGGYIAAGFSESADGDVTVNNGGRDFWVVKLDVAGSIVWQKSLGGSRDDVAQSITSNPDGTYVVAGYTGSNNGLVTGNHGEDDFWVVKLDGSGEPVWQQSLGGSRREMLFSIQSTADNGFVMVGWTNSNDGDVSGNHGTSGNRDIWLVKLGGNGSMQWQKCYGGDFSDEGYFVQTTPDGGYVLSGASESKNGDVQCNTKYDDSWIIKTDNSGNIEWSKNIGTSYLDEAYCVQPLSDGGYIIAAGLCSSDVSGWHAHNTPVGTCGDYWIIKLASPAQSLQNPTVKIDGSSAILCGGRATLTATVKYAGVKYKYLWKRNGAETGVTSPQYSGTDFKENEEITCQITTGGICEDVEAAIVSDKIVLKENPVQLKPAINIASNTSVVCECNSVKFTATVSNPGIQPEYRWLVNDLSMGVSGSVFVTKDLKGGDVVKCLYADQKACFLNAPVLSDSIVLKTNDPVYPTVRISASGKEICKEGASVFKAITTDAGARPIFHWKINGTPIGGNADSLVAPGLKNKDIVTCDIEVDPLFICTMSTTANSNDITVSIEEKKSPVITISASDTLICRGKMVNFIAQYSSAGSKPDFAWTVNGAVVGSNTNTFSSALFEDSDLVSCVINADVASGCFLDSAARSNDIVLTVKEGIEASLQITPLRDDICIGDAATFKAIAQNAGAMPLYEWNINSRPLSSSSALIYTTNSLQPGDSVFCRLYPKNGACSNDPVLSNTVYLNVNQPPLINISPLDTLVRADNSIQLTASVTGDKSTFRWIPADKLIDALTLIPTTVRLNKDQIYTLSAVSDKGCVATENVKVRVFYPLFMPSAFTPNKDGVNDVFRIPLHVSLVLKEFSVYNRWGKKVFTTRDISKGWDGMENGVDAALGTYVYFIKGLTDKGDVSVNGTVLLTR